jgi:hypothetical protein
MYYPSVPGLTYFRPDEERCCGRGVDDGVFWLDFGLEVLCPDPARKGRGIAEKQVRQMLLGKVKGQSGMGSVPMREVAAILVPVAVVLPHMAEWCLMIDDPDF